MQDNWKDFIPNPDLTIHYEDLIAQPAEVLRRILEWLQLPPINTQQVVDRTVDNRTFRMTRPDRQRVIEILENQIPL